MQLWHDGGKSAIARIFNVYEEYCEYERTAQVVPALIRKAINYPKEDFVVWGNGNQTRNLIYIADCVDALLKKASYPPLFLTIGNPETTTIRELAETVVKVSGKKIPIRYDTLKPVGPISRIPDTQRAYTILEWEAQTKLEDGVERTYRWIAAQIFEAHAFQPTRSFV
jgi:nucleoside-diphosphate-sugar epimerase